MEENYTLVFTVVEFDYALSEYSESALGLGRITYSMLKLVPKNTK